jgi:cyclase
MKQITSNVYVKCGLRGCNLGFVTTKEGVVMIDTPLHPTDTMNWREEIRRKGDVKYVINTDPHPDHNSGNYFFPGICIAQQEGRKALLSRKVDQVIGIVRSTDPKGLDFMKGYRLRLPDITFSESLHLHVGTHTFCLIHLPGHAPGVIGVHIPEESVVFASDTIFYREKSYLNEATPYEWIESLKKIAELDVDVIVPGHGDGICTKEYIQEQARIIEAWVDAVKEAICNGLSPEEAAAKIVCPDPYPLPKQLPWTESDLNKNSINRLYKLLNR